MFCTNCGNLLKEKMNFCNKCGHKLLSQSDKSNNIETENEKTINNKPGSNTTNPQNILASRGQRFVNYFIDKIVGCILAAIAIYLITTKDTYNEYSIINRLLLISVFFIVYFLYYYICELNWGRTLGKLVTGTKVVSFNGDKPTTEKLFKRNITRFAVFEPLTGFSGESCLPIHDTISSLYVVKSSATPEEIRNANLGKFNSEQTEDKMLLVYFLVLITLVFFYSGYFNN